MELLPKLKLKKNETEIILFHVADDSIYSATSMGKVAKTLIEEATKTLEEIKKKIVNDLEINVSINIIDGFFKKELRKTITTVTPDLVILFSKSKYGQKSASFIGVIEAPLLIIPKNFNLNQLSRMGLAIDRNESPTLETLWKIRTIADYFQSQVKLFHISNENKTENNFYQNISTVIGFGDIEIINENNILEGINTWSRNNNIDVIITLTHTKGFFEKLTTNSTTKDLVKENQTSLLIITQ